LIILDTSFLFALKAKKDKHFSRAHEILDLLLNEYKEIFITAYFMLNETITLAVDGYEGNIKVVEKFSELFWGKERFFDLIEFTNGEYKRFMKLWSNFVATKSN